jgi:putative hydrolase of the HAD superfamily
LRYKAVIFDLFGTLVNVFSRREYEHTVAEMVAILKAPDDEFTRLWYQTGKPRSIGTFRTLEENLEYICRELKIPVVKTRVKKACRVRMEFVVSALTPKPDALETLARLKSDGYILALISNCSTEPPILWPDTPFAPYFDVAIFSSVCGLRKPDPLIFRLAAEKISINPEDCLFVGDGDDGELNGALEAGMHPVLIRDLNEDGTNVIRNNGEPVRWQGQVISSLGEVLDLVK